ncbi:MAG: polyphosphate kinase 1, partial [Marivirga sp.]|nr:polyphosphate kinase 1 [Marivirga sp.]
MAKIVKYRFFDRDLSWLSFNGRVLAEAQRQSVPLMERFKFLSIFSSNLDEFYRVRMPALLALKKLGEKGKSVDDTGTLSRVNAIIYKQQIQFGKILTKNLLPELEQQGINLLFNRPIPKALRKITDEYFFQDVAGFIQWTELTEKIDLFPGNNKLYLITTVKTNENQIKYFLLNIPSDQLPRFFCASVDNSPYIIFLDDLIKSNLHRVFKDYTYIGSQSFKVTRDAELDLKDEFEGNLAKKIEREISRRDQGLATRFLHDSSIRKDVLEMLSERLGLQQATLVQGGAYHNLKDLATLPLKNDTFYYQKWPSEKYVIKPEKQLLLDHISRKEILLHLPFHSYDTVLRFFNEAAIDADVTRIYV